jgi:hypothetical protein
MLSSTCHVLVEVVVAQRRPGEHSNKKVGLGRGCRFGKSLCRLHDGQLPDHEPNHLVMLHHFVVVVSINGFMNELLRFRELGIKSAVGRINVKELSRPFFSLFEAVACNLDEVLPLGANRREQRVVPVLHLLELSSAAAGLHHLEVSGAHVSDALLIKRWETRIVEVDTLSVAVQFKLVLAVVLSKHHRELEEDLGGDELLGPTHDSHVGDNNDNQIVGFALAEVDDAALEITAFFVAVVVVVVRPTRCQKKEQAGKKSTTTQDHQASI